MLKSALLALALSVISVPASATNHVFIEGDGILIEATGCDTLKQAQAAISAWENHGYDGFSQWLRAQGSARNYFDEPVCGNALGPMIAVATHSEHSVIYNGASTIMYLVEFFLPEMGVSFFSIITKPTAKAGSDA